MPPSWLLALSIVLAACGEPHVVLQAARPDAPLPEREKSYQHLQPAATGQTVVVNQSDGSISAHRSSVILANGQTVHHPEDMIPVVAADSPTAEAGRRHQHHDRWDSVGWTLSSVGVLVALGSIAIPVIDELDKANPSPDIWWTGVIAGAVAVVVGSGMSYYHGSRARDAKVAAFATYDASLREYLHLCVAGTRLVDCSSEPAPPPAAPPPAAPPPGAGAE